MVSKAQAMKNAMWEDHSIVNKAGKCWRDLKLNKHGKVVWKSKSENAVANKSYLNLIPYQKGHCGNKKKMVVKSPTRSRKCVDGAGNVHYTTKSRCPPGTHHLKSGESKEAVARDVRATRRVSSPRRCSKSPTRAEISKATRVMEAMMGM